MTQRENPDPRRARLQARLLELEQRCADAGLPVTVQRRCVFEILVGRSDHPTAEQIFTGVAARLSEVSRATVYRTLETLGELGLLQRVPHPGPAVRFDGNTEPHHHFLCSRCGALEDLPLDSVRGHTRLTFVDDGARRVEGIAVHVRGLCGVCASER